jgi:hypothetical protein
MRLLIVSNCENYDPQTINDCKTRKEFIIFLLKITIKTVENFNHIDLLFAKAYPFIDIKDKSKKYTINNFPDADCTIFCDESGFYKKNEHLFEQIKKSTNSIISVFCDNSKYKLNENLTFVYSKSINDVNTIKIKYPLDYNIYSSRKNNRIIYILIDKPKNKLKNHTEELQKILTNIKSLMLKNESITFEIGLIDHDSVEYIDINFNILNIKKFDIYIDFILEISKAHFYFITQFFCDTFLLYELAICDTISISKKNVIDDSICKELNIYVYDENIIWDDIFRLMIMYDKRKYLIENGFNRYDVVNNIINAIENKELINISSEKELVVNTTKKMWKNIGVLNIIDKGKPKVQQIKFSQNTNTTRSITTKETVNSISKKLPPVFQSHLLKH